VLRGPPTRNLEAYQLFLEAMADQARGRLRPAFDKLQRALQLDPGFAQARAAVVAVRSVAMFHDLALPGSLADAEQEARHALELQPDSAATHAALGAIRAAQARWPEAEESFRRALEIDDTDPWAWSEHGLYVFSTVGYIRAYLSSSSEAHRPAHLQLAAAHLRAGNDDEVRQHARAAIDLGMSRASFPLADTLWQVEIHSGRFDVARRLMQEACMATMGVSREIEAVDRVYGALAGNSHPAAAVAALDAFRTDAGLAASNHIMRRRLLVWYSMLGAYDQAFEIMNAMLDSFADRGTIGASWGTLWARELAGFRADARFTALATRMRLPEYWERYGPPDGYEWRKDRLVAR
jgi:tetratricopeptide (TPR) repeat protein